MAAEPDQIQLDARLAYVLGVGLPAPSRERTPEQWSTYWRAWQAARDELRRRADAGASVAADPQEVARCTAALGDVHDPQREETIRLLCELVLMIQSAGWLGHSPVYMVGGLADLGWPTDPEAELMCHAIAAVDLGLLDPPGTPRREWVDPEADWEYPPGSVRIGPLITALEPQVNYLSRSARREPPPPPPPPPLRERFLIEWEDLLGGIADRIVEALIDEGFIDYDGVG